MAAVITHWNHNPYLLHTKFLLPSQTQYRMIKLVEQQISTANYHGGYTFQVREFEHTDFAQLYRFFFAQVVSIFGPFTLRSDHRSHCWANVYNSANYKSNLHNHKKTATFNAVYYLKMPPDSGEILFVVNSIKSVFLPDEMDLIIMPAWMNHEPMPNVYETNRISINMEIACNESCDKLYTLDALHKYGVVNGQN